MRLKFEVEQRGARASLSLKRKSQKSNVENRLFSHEIHISYPGHIPISQMNQTRLQFGGQNYDVAVVTFWGYA